MVLLHLKLHFELNRFSIELKFKNHKIQCRDQLRLYNNLHFHKPNLYLIKKDLLYFSSIIQ